MEHVDIKVVSNFWEKTFILLLDGLHERRFSGGFYNLRCKMVGWDFEIQIFKLMLVFQLATSNVLMI